MPLPELTLALLALLLTPGPTNTLMALAGAEGGFRRALRLIPAELAGYMTAVLPLALVGTSVLAAVPPLRPLVTFVAALWVLALAVRMWRLPVAPDDHARKAVTALQVLVTTLLNPKALVIGLALLPSDEALAPRVALFAGLIIVVASLWIGLGRQLVRTGPQGGLAPWLTRAAAAWLAILSATLAVKAMAG